MNKTFVIIDRNNNVQKTATGIVKFIQDSKNYLIYCVDENAENKQIFVSRLILNSEGKYFIENILPEEKSKLSEIVYNVIILMPTNYKKGESADTLLNNLTEKYKVSLSKELPELNEQEYYNNCSIAITSKELVALAVEFFNENLNITAPVKEELNQNVPTWEIPSVNSNQEPLLNVNPQENIVQNVGLEQGIVMNNQPNENVIQKPTQEVKDVDFISQNTQINNEIAKEQLIQPAQPVVEPQIMAQPVIDSNAPVNQNVVEPNPQAEKLAVVSDPSLVNITGQPNVVKLNNKGKANVKYIVIGSICILLAIAVVIVAYILIQKKTTGV